MFNNDFNILPAGLPTGFMSAFPRANEGSKDGLDGADEGFDLYVGRAGIGTMEITAGGRAEIHDAVIVGDMPGSVGTLIVDGIDSFLGSGGLEAAGSAEIHQIIIGRQGTGLMTITNGGTVLSEATQSVPANFDTIGAVIGSDPQMTQADETGTRRTRRGERHRAVFPLDCRRHDADRRIYGGQRRRRRPFRARIWNTTAKRGAARCAYRPAAWCTFGPQSTPKPTTTNCEC